MTLFSVSYGLIVENVEHTEYKEEIKVVHNPLAPRELLFVFVCRAFAMNWFLFFSNSQECTHFLDTSSSRQLICLIRASHY